MAPNKGLNFSHAKARMSNQQQQPQTPQLPSQPPTKIWIPSLNQRPTQYPLTRDQQMSAYEQRKNAYFVEAPPTPVFPLQPAKDTKLTERQMLEATQAQMSERGLQVQLAKVEEKLEENKQTEVIKQFYCTHNFQMVKAQISVIPIRYKICKLCGLVK
jgi:hypothetical protein